MLKILGKTVVPICILCCTLLPSVGHAVLIAANTGEDLGYSTSGRTINVEMLVVQQTIKNNRLGAELTNGQIFVLARDVVPNDAPYNQYGQDTDKQYSVKALHPGKVRLRSYKRPRPIVLRVNVGDTLNISLTNLLPTSISSNTAALQVMGLEWLSDQNGNTLSPGDNQTFSFKATGEGVYMMYAPDGKGFGGQLDLYL